jgi:3-hydroxybutyryl-CoA dehydrogenase
MRLIILGEPNHSLAADLSARFTAAGVEVIRPPQEDGDIAAFLDAAHGADAGIDFCVPAQDLKTGYLALLDRSLPLGAPLLTCCHAASATSLAAKCAHPDEIAGFALLPPWDNRTTVECARALQTSDATVAAAEIVWGAIGLEPVWVGDSAGLVLPRIVACLANEAFFALMDGTASAADIDQAMMLGTRYPRGPLAWAELIGLDHVLATLDALAAEQGDDRYRAAPLLRRLVAAGMTGIDR